MPTKPSRPFARCCGMFGFLLALLALGSFATTSPTFAASNSGTYRVMLPMVMSVRADVAIASAAETQAINLTNQLRQQHGCPPLNVSAELTAAARAHSQDMADHNYFDHVDLSGHHSDWRAAQAGYAGTAGWENIGAGYQTAEQMVSAWYNETPPNDGHRRNLLNCALTDVGIGYAANTQSEYGIYWTQDFGER